MSRYTLLVPLVIFTFAYYYQVRTLSPIVRTKPAVDNMSLSRHVIKRVFAVEQSEVCILSTSNWLIA